jgi:hypothetical protein
MKKYLNNASLLIIAVAIIFSACKKQESNIIYTGGTAPVLSSNLTDNDTLALVPSDSTNNLISLSWTNPNYTFSNGLNSQNVNYYIEFDTLGANFSSSTVQQVSVNASALDSVLTVGGINSILGNQLSLSLGQPHNVQIRVKSFLGSNAAPLYSNVLNYVVVPYAPPPKLTPPSTGTLFIVGSAVGSWDNPITQSVAAQQFTQVSPTEYKITIALVGGQEYKWIAQDGSWTEQWSVATTDDPAEIFGGPFVSNGNNTLAPPTSGTYVIDVNFQTGLFTVTAQ